MKKVGAVDNRRSELSGENSVLCQELSAEVTQVIRAFLTLNFLYPRITLKGLILEIEKRAIEETLVLTGGRKRNAARFLRIGESTLCEKIKRLHIFETPSGEEFSWSLPIPSYLLPFRKENERKKGGHS